MAKTVPKIRDEVLHKLRHHRKAGAHTLPRKPDPEEYLEIHMCLVCEHQWFADAPTDPCPNCGTVI